MYEPFFEFRERPFSPVPRAKAYFPGATIEAARTTLVRCVRRAEGPGVVIGPSGTGKTILCQVLADELADQLRVVLLASGRLGSRRALLQAILYELGQPYRGLTEGEARLALADYVTLSDECPNGVLLLVDEAHTLPLRLLDEVRTTTNLAHEGKPWVRVVLAGGCALEERFASPKLDSFNQRIAARCYLEPFGAAETQQYIWAQANLAGGRGEWLFPAPACQAVYRATDGVPRLVNQVCDHALLLACAAGHRQVDPRHVEEAWADLQQLPTPWNGPSPQGDEAGDVIEFGRLDDDDAGDGHDAEPSDEAEPSGHPGPSGDAEETPDTIPVLRISAEPDECAEPEADGECRAGQDEHTADPAGAEDAGFAPAGSIGPEIELRFDGPHDPFGEEFAEEEIVEDWPGTVGRGSFPKSDDRQTSRPEPAAAALAAPIEKEPSDGEPHPELLQTASTSRPAAAAPIENEPSDVEPDPEPHRAASTSRPAAAPRPRFSRLFATLRQG